MISNVKFVGTYLYSKHIQFLDIIMVMHSLRITHQEELLCKFIHRHPHPVCCTEYHVVAVQVLGSHTAVVVVAVLDEAVQIVTASDIRSVPSVRKRVPFLT